MAHEKILNAFITLGDFLRNFSSETAVGRPADAYARKLEDLVALSQSHNGWYTPEQVRHALQSWAEALQEPSLRKWLSQYDIPAEQSKAVGLVLAGNIPLVGFHDFLCVLLSGHRALVKLSSNDQKLLPFLAKFLIDAEPVLQDRIYFTEGKLEGYDAVIATGSNNTARYFEYYFRDTPSIIRKNRNSVAVLTGNETKEELEALGEDIFRYFGLGCRNVSKLLVPEGYDFTSFFEAMYRYRDVIHYEKYANNYDYNKAVFLMSNFKILDNGFLTIKEDSSYASPISTVFYEFYADLDQAIAKLEADSDIIQCVVSNKLTANSIPFGQTQQPQLWDYADNVDTLRFLLSL